MGSKLRRIAIIAVSNIGGNLTTAMIEDWKGGKINNVMRVTKTI